MNNDEPNKIPASELISEPAPQPASEPAGTWVPQKEYQEFKNHQVAEIAMAQRSNTKARVFYILLAVGGLLVAIAFIGGLVAPSEAVAGRRAACTVSSFVVAQYYLNLIGYSLLLATGIFGATIKKKLIRHIGINLIIFAPIIGIFLFFVSVVRGLCGV